MKNGFILFALSVVMLSCGSEYTRDFTAEGGGGKLVIDGLVITETDSSRVIISRTSADYKTGSVEYVDNATVTISDDSGNSTLFVHNPNGRFYKGYYAPATSGFKGVGGRKYFLSITLDGKNYQATDKLNALTTAVDKVVLVKNEYKTSAGTGWVDSYYPDLYLKTPTSEGPHYYMIRYYYNLYSSTRKKNIRVRTRQNDVTVVDDMYNDIYKSRIQGGVCEAISGWYYDIEIYSISLEVSRYYYGLQTIFTSDGGVFFPPQANPPNNLPSGVLGVFRASDKITAKSDVVQ